MTLDSMTSESQYRGMFNESGPDLLAKAIEKEGITLADLERDLGIEGNGLITRWLKKQRRPGLDLAVKLERRLGIPVESWIGDESAEQGPHERW